MKLTIITALLFILEWLPYYTSFKHDNYNRFNDRTGIVSHYSSARRKPLDKSKLKYIEIGGLFPMNGLTGWLGGQGCLPAAMMALEDVNNNENLLSGYYLNITWNNSQV